MIVMLTAREARCRATAGARSLAEDLAGAEQSGDGADGDREDSGSEDVREQGMVEGNAAQALSGEIGIRNLEGHPDRQSEIREVPVVGHLVMEVDPAFRRAVVEPRVAKDKHGVHRRPCKRDAPEGERRQKAAPRSAGVACLPERERHRDKARGPGAYEDGFRGSA